MADYNVLNHGAGPGLLPGQYTAECNDHGPEAAASSGGSGGNLWVLTGSGWVLTQTQGL